MTPADELNRIPGEQIDRLKIGTESLREMFETRTDAIRAKEALNSQLRAQLTALTAERDGMVHRLAIQDAEIECLRIAAGSALRWIERDETTHGRAFGCGNELRAAIWSVAPVAAPAIEGKPVLVVVDQNLQIGFTGTVYLCVSQAIHDCDRFNKNNAGAIWTVRRATLQIGEAVDPPPAPEPQERDKFDVSEMRFRANREHEKNGDTDTYLLLSGAADHIERLESQLAKSGKGDAS